MRPNPTDGRDEHSLGNTELPIRTESDNWLLVTNVERSAISGLDPIRGETTVFSLDRSDLPSSDQFAVGDRVTVDVDNNGSVVAVVRAERETSLVRFRLDPSRRGALGEEHVLAANADIVLIIVSATDVKPRLIDRYLIVAQYGGVEPVIVVNKIDRWKKPTDNRRDVEVTLGPYRELGVRYVYVSATRGDNMDQLRTLVDQQTAVLSGQSGVGKSSLVNTLAGRTVLETTAVRTSDERGRHTTSSSLVVALGEGTYIIDTPGIRQLENLQRDDPVALGGYFPEIQQLREGCRFANCLHIPEPDCAVKTAVLEFLADDSDSRQRDDSHKYVLSYSRYDSYLSLADPDGDRRAQAEQRASEQGTDLQLLPWTKRRQGTASSS